MSVFSIIRRGRAQAKEHNAKQAEKAKEESVKLPYRHVVTHAASDALSGAPSSWKHADRTKIMEQNKRRTAIMAGETNMAGMPRVGSSLSYVSYASVYATPVVPLPKNYSYNNVPTPWREQLANFQEGHDYLAQPRSLASAKGKEPEYLRPSPSIGPVPRLSPGQSSGISSKGVSLNASSGNISGSDDEPEMKNKIIINRRAQNLAHQPSVSRQSTSSSEKSYRTPLTSSGTTVEVPAKTDRYYPPPAQSTYFSAPRPLSRRSPGAETSVPPVPAITQRVGSTASSSTSGHFSTASSAESIGVAIAPPQSPPCAIESLTVSPAVEKHAALEQQYNKTAVANVPLVQPTPQRFSTGQFQLSADANPMKVGKHVLAPPAQPTQRRRRRLSKSRPPSTDDSGIRISVETVRPTKTSVTVTSTPTPTGGLGQIDHTARHRVEETTPVVPAPESVRPSHGKLSKDPEVKHGLKAWWSLRFGGKTPTVTAH
ncbi:hypothetical protein F4804DRAFT_331526 [Jackrogersella minutella]|nr:hypothetical protein F4804DRAFT_331526 [Jackrogersella minutella]